MRPENVMKLSLMLTAAVLLAAPLVVTAQAPSAADQIAQAVLVLPADLRAGATVVTYDKATGARTVLRQGTNFIECQPRMDDGFTRCYNKALGPRRDLEARLRAEKKSDKDISDAVAAATRRCQSPLHSYRPAYPGTRAKPCRWYRVRRSYHQPPKHIWSRAAHRSVCSLRERLPCAFSRTWHRQSLR